MARRSSLPRLAAPLPRLGALLLVTHALAGCEPARPPEPEFGTSPRTLKAPPKPGSSITHTKLCECQTCEPRACCEGDLGEESAQDATCTDSYDFTKEGCGLSVSSCTSRCTRHVWRVRLTEDCEATTPPLCCSAAP